MVGLSCFDRDCYCGKRDVSVQVVGLNRTIGNSAIDFVIGRRVFKKLHFLVIANT